MFYCEPLEVYVWVFLQLKHGSYCEFAF